jgi:hypothetical protein
VTRNPGLALPENLGDFADGEIALRAQRQKAQTRRLGHRPQPRQQTFHARPDAVSRAI